jgi:hypothetical protein
MCESTIKGGLEVFGLFSAWLQAVKRVHARIAIMMKCVFIKVILEDVYYSVQKPKGKVFV